MDPTSPPPIQQRGFPAAVQAIPMPSTRNDTASRRPSASQVSLLTASLQHHSLLSHALRRETAEGGSSAVTMGTQMGIKPWENINTDRHSPPLLHEQQGILQPPHHVSVAVAGPKPILLPGLPVAPAPTLAVNPMPTAAAAPAQSLQQQLQVPKPILLHRTTEHGTAAAVTASLSPAALPAEGASTETSPFFTGHLAPSEPSIDPLSTDHSVVHVAPSLAAAVILGEAPPKSILQHDSAHEPSTGAGIPSQHIIFHPAFDPPPLSAPPAISTTKPTHPQPSLSGLNLVQAPPPNLARKTSLKFAIAAPPTHITPLTSTAATINGSSRRGSLDVPLSSAAVNAGNGNGNGHGNVEGPLASAVGPGGGGGGGIPPDLAAVVEQRLFGNGSQGAGTSREHVAFRGEGEGTSSPPSRTLSRTSSRHLYSEDDMRVIDDIQEEDGEDEDGEDYEEGLSNEEEEDDDDDDDDDEYGEDGLSGENDDDDDDDDDDETQSGANWSGYEEDSEAGLSDEMEDVEYIKKESRIVSPPATFTLGRHQRTRAGATEQEEEEDEDLFGAALSRTLRPHPHPARSPMPNTHFSSIPASHNNNETTAQIPGFAFARPTNYRRRRPASVVSNEGGVASPGTSFVAGGGGAGPIVSAASSSFVKIDPHERLIHRGRGAVQIVDAIPPSPDSRETTTTTTIGAANGRPRQKPTRTNTLTRHCSPPPAPAEHSLAHPPPGATGSTVPRAPPAELSPSAIRMQVRRGVSDSPRKKKWRARQQGLNLFGPGGNALVRAAMMTDDDDDDDGEEEGRALNLAPRQLAVVPTVTATEDEAGLEARRGTGSRTELTSTRGWRSDDALFAVPTVRRKYPNISIRTTSNKSPGPPLSGTGESRSRKASVVSLVVPPTFLSSAPPSDAEHAVAAGRRRGSESVVDGARHVYRRTSERVGQPFAITSPHAHDVDLPVASGAPPNGLLSPIEPSLSLFSASSPCPPAVDDTPALASAASFLPTTPVDQLLHEKLAGTPSRRRGSDAALVAAAHVTAAAAQKRSTEGSGSDGHRSRASSALGFRSDDSRAALHTTSYQQHHRESGAPVSHNSQQQQQQYTHNHLRPDGAETEHDPQQWTAKQTIKSKPIKCPSPRRHAQGNEVRI